MCRGQKYRKKARMKTKLQEIELKQSQQVEQWKNVTK